MEMNLGNPSWEVDDWAPFTCVTWHKWSARSSRSTSEPRGEERRTMDIVPAKSQQPPPTAAQLLRRCIAAVRSPSRASFSSIKRILALALRRGLTPSHPLLAKHLIFSLVSLLPHHPLHLRYAHSLFSLLPPSTPPDPFSLNTLIRGYAQSPDPLPALRLKLSSSVPADTHTYPFLLKACAKLTDLPAGERAHALAVKDGHAGSVFVRNALVHLYGACGRTDSARKVFEEMPPRSLVTWNSVAHGLVANGRPDEALTLLEDMWAEGEETPDGFTLVSLLSASAELGALALGRRAHAYVFKVGLDGNLHVGNALIDLYAKCGSVKDGRRVFAELGTRSVVSWNSLIVGLALNGMGEKVLELFGAMEKAGMVPTEITFVGILYACSHCGLLQEGYGLFLRMEEEYEIVPRIEHYGCMVDLLGRAGLVGEAFRFIIKMPLEPNAVLWRALLGAAAMHKQIAFGEVAWAHLEQLDPGHSGDYVLLSNLYASKGRWADVHRLRRKMVNRGVRKTPGYTIVELGNRVYEFVVGDRSHPESDEIYEKANEIAERLRREGYMASTTNVLADIEEEEKENALQYHSERLAIACALIWSSPMMPIRLVKNLRVCEDCHLAIKLISKVYEREIIVRDRSRFHHFRDGSCSCQDYW